LKMSKVYCGRTKANLICTVVTAVVMFGGNATRS
jgi:hypothetical protein